MKLSPEFVESQRVELAASVAKIYYTRSDENDADLRTVEEEAVCMIPEK